MRLPPSRAIPWLLVLVSACRCGDPAPPQAADDSAPVEHDPALEAMQALVAADASAETVGARRAIDRRVDDLFHTLADRLEADPSLRAGLCAGVQAIAEARSVRLAPPTHRTLALSRLLERCPTPEHATWVVEVALRAADIAESAGEVGAVITYLEVTLHPTVLAVLEPPPHDPGAIRRRMGRLMRPDSLAHFEHRFESRRRARWVERGWIEEHGRAIEITLDGDLAEPPCPPSGGCREAVHAHAVAVLEERVMDATELTEPPWDSPQALSAAAAFSYAQTGGRWSMSVELSLAQVYQLVYDALQQRRLADVPL